MISNYSPFKTGDKVVGYCRYSGGEEQGLTNTSTDEQEAAIRKFCTENGLELVKIYADPFVSGRSIKGREHYLEMMSDLLHDKKHKSGIAGICAWDFERLHRNMDQAQLDAARLRMAGYKIYSLQQPVMDNGPFARVVEAMYFASAQNQSDMISADVKRALQNNYQKYKVIPRSCIGWGWIPEKVDMGTFSDGNPRTGYRAVPDPDKAPLIREAIRQRLCGASLSKCRMILGGKSNLNVKRLFANPLLCGQMIYGGCKIENYCDPIIDQQAFDTLQIFEKTHSGRQLGRQGGWSANPPMLSGLLYCAECGKPIYIYRRKSKGHLYCSYYCEKTCFRGIKQEVIETLVIEACEEILSPDNIHSWISILTEDEVQGSSEEIRIKTESDISTISKKINSLMDLLIAHPSDTLAERIRTMEDDRKELQKRLESLSQCYSAGFATDTLYNSTLELCNQILAVLCNPDASAEAKKTALSAFVRSIIVNAKGEVLINYLPPGYSCNPNRHRPEKNSAENGSVVSQNRLNYQAPPGGVEPSTS